MTPKARATVVMAQFAGVPALVLGLVAGLLGGIIAGLVVLVVVAAGLFTWASLGGERRVVASLGGRPADPRRDARLFNLVQGLSVGVGVRPPRLMVVDAPGLNALAAGTTPRRAVLAVTEGLLAELTRIELEAVLAEELIQIRRSETLPATVLGATYGTGRWVALRPDRETRADLAAVAVTRYPPALASALEKIAAKGAEVPGQPGYLAHLWLADPAPASPAAARPSGPPRSTAAPGASRGRVALSERIGALREL